MFKSANKRKWSIPLAALMAAQMTVWPLTAYADDPGSGSSGAVLPISAPISAPVSDQAVPVGLEKAIKQVKDHFAVPADLSEFSSSFDSGSERQIWNLYWSTKTGPAGKASAQVDAGTGEVVRYNLWQEKDRQGLHVPKLSAAQAREKAETFIKNLLPEKSADLVLVDTQNKAAAINRDGSASYQFKWERTANGVPVLGDGATLQLDADEGTILAYTLVWNEGTFSGTEKAITADQAKQAFGKAGLIKLKYFQAPLYHILKDEDAAESDVQLVYGLTPSDYGLNGAVDALTGEPLQLDKGSYVIYDWVVAQGGNGASEDSTGSALTPEEQSEVDANDKLISKEQAAEKVAQLTDSTTGLALTGGNLYYNQVNGIRLWSLQWSNYTGGEKVKADYNYVSAAVNAETGELLSFYASADSEDAGKEKIGLEAARKAGRDFLQKVQSLRLGQTKLEQSRSEAQGESLPAPEGYTFDYQRVVGNIPFANNSISVSVNPYTGKVTAYNLNWNDNLIFPVLSA